MHETESVVRAAAEQQAELAAVRKAVDNTSAAWIVHGQTVARVLEEEAAHTGFAVSELGQGFIRIESGVKNSEKAIRLLGDAEDVARARHLGLAQASVILARAAQGSDTALRRLGIIIPKLSTNVDELKREHDAAVESGVKFTAGQQASYKAALANAAALDKQASSANVIAEIERRFGGQSARFAQTTAGEFARAGENLHQLKVSLGDDLLPVLNSAAEGVIHEAQAARESVGVHHALADSAEIVRTVFTGAKGAVEAVAPPLEAVAHGLADIARFAGVGGLLTFAVGFKAISVATGAAAAVQARYEAIVAAGTRTEVGAAAATTGRSAATAANTAFVKANTAALADNAAALAAVGRIGLSSNFAAITRGYNVATVGASGLAVATEKAGTASLGLGARLGILGRGLFRLAGGWTTLAAVGIGAATFGLYKLITAESATERANDRMQSSLDALGTSLTRDAKLARDLADAVSSIKSDKVAVESAKAGLATAQQALATSQAAKGSAEYLSLQAQLAQALDSLRVAEKSLADEQQRAARLRRSRNAEAQKTLVEQQNAIDDLVKRRQVAETEATRPIVAGRGGLPITPDARLERMAQQVREFVKATDEAAAKNPNALVRRELQALADVGDALGRLPTQKEIRVVLEAGSARAGIRQILEGLERARPKAAAFATELEREAATLAATNPSLSRRLDLLSQFTETVHRIPTRHETELVLNAPNFKTAEEGLLKILARMDADASQGGARSGRSFVETFAASLKGGGGILDPLLAVVSSVVKGIGQDAGDAAAGAVKDSTKAARDAAKTTAAAARTTVKGIETQLETARQQARDAAHAAKQSAQQIADAEHGVGQAGRQVADAERGVAEAIKSGAQAVRDAVAQADQNLFSIGASLSDTIAQFLDAQAKTQTALTGPQAAEVRRLRAQILAGQGGPDTERAAQELAARIEAAQSKQNQEGLNKRKERVKRDVADLVDEFNKGAISIETFNRRLAEILSREGVTYKKAGKLLGVAFADGFRAELEGLKKQAAAIAAGPRRPGVTGLEPTIVRPIDALRESQKQIAAAQRARDDALYQKTVAIRNLADSQEQHQRAIESETKAQRKLSTLQEQHEKTMQVSAKATERSNSLIEQHTRFLADQAKREAAREKETNRSTSASVNVGPGRGGADLGHSLGSGVTGGVRAEIQNVVSAIEALVGAALTAGRRRARAQSPSAETEELGLDLGRGLSRGLAGSHGPARDAADDLAAATLARLGARLAALRTVVVDELGAILPLAVQRIPRELPERKVTQRIELERRFAETGDLRAFLVRAAEIPAALEDRTVRQRVDLVRDLIQGPSIHDLLAKAETPPPLLPARIVRQRIDLQRDVETSTRSAVSEVRSLAADLRDKVSTVSEPPHVPDTVRPALLELVPPLQAIGRFLREAEEEQVGRDRELVGAVRALGRLEERLGRQTLEEERRQTEQLRRIHDTQRQPAPPSRPERRPTSPASQRARVAATHRLEV